MLAFNGVLVTFASFVLYRERISIIQLLGIVIILVSFSMIAIG